MTSEDSMTATDARSGTTDQIFESVQRAENTALESVRKFLDTVNAQFPDVTADAGPRKRIIDSAFKMTEQLVGTSTDLAQQLVRTSQRALAEVGKPG
jgi:ABC-type transporter Mla subunit MlaD